MHIIESKGIYTASESCVLLGIGRNTLYQIIRDGQLKAIPSKQFKYLVRGCNLIKYMDSYAPAVEPEAAAPEERTPHKPMVGSGGKFSIYCIK